MRVLVFGTYDLAAHPRAATIAEGLRARGFDVTECNAPLGLNTADRVDTLARPSRIPAFLLTVLRRWSVLARRARRSPKPDVVLVPHLGHFDVHLARLLFRGVPIVLDHLIGASATATDRRLDGGARQAVLRLIDTAALRAASVVVVDTDEHRGALPPQYRSRAVVVPVGAPAAWFDAARSADGTADGTAADGPLRVVFFGLYTPLQGTPVIGAALGQLADAPVAVTMIGTGQDEAETKAAAGANAAVRWLDWVPAAELPELVAGHDVCLGIFGTGDKALRVVPNKVFQGAAAGCAVVTSDTAPQRRALGDAAVLVPAGDPTALAGALRSLAADRAELARLRTAAHESVRRRFAPEQVVAPLVERLADRGGVDMTAGSTTDRPNADALAPLATNAWLRYDVITRMLPPGVRDVLEVGCGQGAVGARLAQRYSYLGVEPDATSYQVASRRVAALGGGGEVRQLSVAELEDATFDLVCAFEVLEHIEDDAAALAEWAARLRPGGWLLLSVPAHQRRYAAFDELVGHFRRYDPDAMRALLRSAGFTDITIRLYGMPLGYVLEAGRNVIGRRRLGQAAGDASVAERTAGSGRLLQPSGGAQGAAIRLATAPFRLVQRAFPNTGVGMVVRARLAT